MSEQWKEKILNNLPGGWVLAFGDLLCEELSKVVSDKFDILEVKEKFGTLRIYYGGPVSDEVRNIIMKYEYISKYVCHHCGKPDVCMIDIGYSISCCNNCYYKFYYKDLLYTDVAIRYPAQIPDIMITHKYVEGMWINEPIDISVTVRKIRERYIDRIMK